LKITFLGTGTSQGIPVIGSQHPVCHSTDARDRRLRVSVLIQWEDYNVIIDCGPDFREQMLGSLSLNCGPNNPLPKVAGILFTHEHADHVAGLDDIRPFVFNQGDMPIYGHRRVLDTLKRRFDYIVATKNRYPGAPSVSAREVQNNVSIAIGGIEVVPIEVFHGSLQVFGYRFDRIAYLTDVKTIAPKEIEKLKGLDILVINALRYESHDTHLNIEEAIALADQIGAKRTYFTHISHIMGFHAEVEKNIPPNIYLAYDGLTLTTSNET
jgi:phosphoribosyl 1,2-cyclic phosphate phosphodiesterase